MKSPVLIFLILLLASCAKSTEQKVQDALDQAQTFLSDGECSKAIKVLEEVGNQPKNPVYLSIYSSAHACKADFDMIKFISDDIETLDTTTFEDTLRTVSILSLSNESSPDSAEFVGMKEALEILLQDGETAPSQANREDQFGPRKASDLGIQILVYSLVQLGKFVNLYGDVDSLGVKGGGSGTNACFIDYTFGPAQLVRAATGGSCNSDTSGHPGLSITAPNEVRGNRRRCEGLMLLTNIIDVLNNLDVSDSETFEDLEEIAAQANLAVDTAVAAYPAIEELIKTTSQSACEKLLESSTESDNMELIYASVFERYLQ